MTRAGQYLEFLAAEYLDGYVDAGGSTVKLVVPADQEAGKKITAGLADVDSSFRFVAVDAATTRVHLAQEVFFAIAGQVDWMGLAARVVHRVYIRAGFEPPGEQNLAISDVATFHGVETSELHRSVRRQLEREVLHDMGLAHEFRVAMFRLCQALLATGDVTGVERRAVLGWLTGEKVPAAQLRSAGLYNKIARHNARVMLTSLTRWTRSAGHSGTVLLLDVERLTVARRPPTGQRDGFYYSRAATLDAYEVLRQLIDATDEVEGLLAVVLVPPELLTDEKRGVESYQALWMRVVDEVRDRRRENPYATLVRVEA